MADDNRPGIGIGAALRWAFEKGLRPIRGPKIVTPPSETSEGSFLAAIARVGRAADRLNFVSALVGSSVGPEGIAHVDQALRRLSDDVIS